MEGTISLYLSIVSVANAYDHSTNWGNLGHPGGYTSYDYGAAIAEDRTVTREKYSEVKLQANFLRVSPAYLTAVPLESSNGSYVDTDDLDVTRISGDVTGFYVIRHAAVCAQSAGDFYCILMLCAVQLLGFNELQVDSPYDARKRDYTTAQ